MNKRVSQIFVDKAMKGEILNIHGKNEFLDFTYVKDVANGFVLSATSKIFGEDFNITNGKAHTLIDFAKILKKNLGKNLHFKILKRDSFRPKRGTLSINKAEKLLKYKPNYTLEKGLREYIYFKKNKIIK